MSRSESEPPNLIRHIKEEAAGGSLFLLYQAISIYFLSAIKNPIPGKLQEWNSILVYDTLKRMKTRRLINDVPAFHQFKYSVILLPESSFTFSKMEGGITMINRSIGESIRIRCTDMWNAFMVQGAEFVFGSEIPICSFTSKNIPKKLISNIEANCLHIVDCFRGKSKLSQHLSSLSFLLCLMKGDMIIL